MEQEAASGRPPAREKTGQAKLLVLPPLTTYLGGMNNPALDSGEVNQLKQEIAALQQQMQSLSQKVKGIARFVDVEPADPQHGVAERVVVSCTHLMVFHRRGEEKETQIRLTASKKGPSLTLYGTDDHPRIALHAEDDKTQLEMFSKNWDLAAQIEADQTTGRGLVGVFDKGKPRAAIKAGDDEGVVTVVHDDGRTRVCMRSSAEKGELNVVSAETRAVVSLSGTPAGGALHLNNSSGGRQAILAVSPGGGQLLLFNDLGIERAHLGSAGDSSALKLNWGGHDGVLLAALDTGGMLVFNDAEGNPVAKLPDLGEE